MKPEPKIYPYLTVEEMRSRRDLIEDIPKQGGGTRFEGSTVSDLALEYFKKQDKVLECGAVFGAFTKFMTDRGYSNYHVLDFADLLHFTDDRSKFKFQLIDFNLEKFPYEDKYFDGVTAWGLGEHLENPFHFSREVWRVLKPGGVFLYSLPNIHHLSSRMNFLLKGVFPRWNLKSNHITIIPRGVIEKTMLRYFDVEKIIYTSPGTMTTRKHKYWPRIMLDKLSKKVLPKNELFGNYVCYVLRRKENYTRPIY